MDNNEKHTHTYKFSLYNSHTCAHKLEVHVTRNEDCKDKKDNDTAIANVLSRNFVSQHMTYKTNETFFH